MSRRNKVPKARATPTTTHCAECGRDTACTQCADLLPAEATTRFCACGRTFWVSVRECFETYREYELPCPACQSGLIRVRDEQHAKTRWSELIRFDALPRVLGMVVLYALLYMALVTPLFGDQTLLAVLSGVDQIMVDVARDHVPDPFHMLFVTIGMSLALLLIVIGPPAWFLEGPLTKFFYSPTKRRVRRLLSESPIDPVVTCYQ